MREIRFDAIYEPTGAHFKPIEINFNDNTVTGKLDGNIVDWCHFSLDGKKGDAILRQYTGLKDKNGKEIYEGDIARVVSLSNDHHQRGAITVSPVEFWNGSACFSLNHTPISRFLIRHEIEVIGNIYEHPHLLKEANTHVTPSNN